MVLREEILGSLPPYEGRRVLIKQNQDVDDIIKEVLASHKLFARHYDSIYYKFEGKSERELFRNLFDFLKTNIEYREESDRSQMTKSPAALLHHGYGDCKHYALFIAGVLDARGRAGAPVDWEFVFASYSPVKVPGHVFVRAWDSKGREYWIDPVLSDFDSRIPSPTFVKTKKISGMALYRVSGIGQSPAVYEEGESISPELEDAIRLLLHYGVLNVDGQINDRLLMSLQSKVTTDEFIRLMNARKLIERSAVSGFFDSIWKGIKKVSLAVPRNAYLSIVGLNAFNTATKLNLVLNDPEGREQLKKKWESLGGDFKKLENTILDGAKKKPILGKVGNPAPAAWAVTAATIIAAIAPIISSVLKKTGTPPIGGETDPYPYGVCEDGSPRMADGTCPVDTGSKTGLPLPLIIGGGLLLLFLLRKKRS